MNPPGQLRKIWLKRARRGPMDEYGRAELAASLGLVGNTDQRGKRQITIIGLEAWQEIMDALTEERDAVVRVDTTGFIWVYHQE